jgi:membrane protein
MLTSMFPFFIFVTALAGFLGTAELAQEATKLIFEAWPQVVAGPIAGEVQNVLTQPRGGLLTIGAVLALYFSSSGIEALRTGLNRAYDALDHRPVHDDRLVRHSDPGVSGGAGPVDLVEAAGLRP